jgi:hypothetical protein
VPHAYWTVAGAALVAAAIHVQTAVPRTFDEDKAGLPPPGFVLSAMRQPVPGVWTVRRTGTNGALCHDADPAHAGGFSMAIAQGDPLEDVVVSVRMRFGSGAHAGGLVWRYNDPGHYFAVILDLTRQELVLYRVVDGNRIRLESEDGLELDVSAWHTLKIVHEDARVSVLLGGIRVFQDESRAHRQIGAGRAGLVATGDSEVWFDDLRVEVEKRRR